MSRDVEMSAKYLRGSADNWRTIAVYLVWIWSASALIFALVTANTSDPLSGSEFHAGVFWVTLLILLVGWRSSAPTAPCRTPWKGLPRFSRLCRLCNRLTRVDLRRWR